MIEHRGDFYGVGQGLFASGAVTLRRQARASLNYVYDCGTETSHSLLKECIQEAVSELPKRPLDLLFLSHMHWDHISGLEFLLEQLHDFGGVSKVFLPYLYPAERVAILAYAFDSDSYPGAPGDWYSGFLTAPGTYLREHGAKEVYFVRGGDGPEPTPLSEVIPRGPTEEGPNRDESVSEALRATTRLSPKGQDQIQRCQSLETDISGDSASSLKNLISSRSTIGALYWFFILFNKDVDEDKLVGFFEEFDDIRDGSSLADVLQDARLRNRVRAAYKALVGSDLLNDSSLAVLSACDVAYLRRRKRMSFDCVEAPCMPSRCRLPTGPLCTFEDDRRDRPPRGRGPTRDASCVGIVYTGDLPVNDLWLPFSKKFGLYPTGSGTIVLAYQIPHHGSAGNWHRPQAEIGITPTYVLSAGTKNRHKHPAPEVLRDIAACNRRLIWVHEGCSFPHRLQIED